MMKVEVKKTFRDKYTNELYESGSIVEFEDARAEEILSDKREIAVKAEDKPKRTRKKKKEA